MITSEIENTSFNTYVFDSESEQLYGFDIDKFVSKAKESVKFGKVITFAIDDVSTSITCGQFNFTTKTMLENEVYRNEPRIPEMELNSEFVISAKNFINAVKSLDKKGHARVTMHDDNIELVQVDDEDVITITFGDEVTIKKHDNARTLYSNDYLIKVMDKVRGLCTKLSFEFNTDFPCCISNNDGEINFKFMLAPRIESD